MCSQMNKDFHKAGTLSSWLSGRLQNKIQESQIVFTNSHPSLHQKLQYLLSSAGRYFALPRIIVAYLTPT